jgi:predicted dehydrogenase
MQKDDRIAVTRHALDLVSIYPVLVAFAFAGIIANCLVSGKNERIKMRVIQIGVGGNFGGHWLRVLDEYPGVTVVGLVDIDEQNLTEAAQRYEISPQCCFLDLDSALAAVTADALICVSPPIYHRQHTIAAMDAGLDVICEKPVAILLEDAVAMAQKAVATGRVFSVSQNYRYRPSTWTMHKLISAREIGEIGQIALDFFKGCYFESNDFRRKMVHPLLSDMAIHHFDLLRFICGQEATSVQGASWNPPWSNNSGDTSVALSFTLQGGARFSYSASWCTQGDFTDWNGNWLIEGDVGSLHYRDGKLTLNQAPLRYQVIASQLIQQVGPPLLDQAYVLADFLAARKEGRQPATSVFDNLNSLAMVAAAREAAESGRILPIPSSAALMA